MSNKVLSICTGAGLLDRAFIDAGFDVVPGCEIDPRMRRMYEQVCGGKHLTHDLRHLIGEVCNQDFVGVIGGPPCQAHSKLKSIRTPKYPDLTPLVDMLLASLGTFRWFLFENVVPLSLSLATKSVLLNAMHFHKPHQSRPRWFTHSPGLQVPRGTYDGTADDLLAYPIVAGKLYGKNRAAILQGASWFLDQVKAPAHDMVMGLVNAVPYPLGRAWAESIRESSLKRRPPSLGREP